MKSEYPRAVILLTGEMKNSNKQIYARTAENSYV